MFTSKIVLAKHDENAINKGEKSCDDMVTWNFSIEVRQIYYCPAQHNISRSTCRANRFVKEPGEKAGTDTNRKNSRTLTNSPMRCFNKIFLSVIASQYQRKIIHVHKAFRVPYAFRETKIKYEIYFFESYRVVRLVDYLSRRLKQSDFHKFTEAMSR